MENHISNFYRTIGARYNGPVLKAVNKLYNALNESLGIIDYGNKELDNFLFNNATQLNNIIHNNQFDDLSDAIIEEIYPYEFKAFMIDFSIFNNEHWISKLYILLTSDMYDNNDALVLDKSTITKVTNIYIDKKVIEPISILDDIVNHATIILNYTDAINEHIIYKILRHELKHIYHRYKRNVANDDLYKANIKLNEYIDCDVPLFSVKSQNELIHNIRYKARMEDILMFLYSNTYLLNTSEIQAKLEDFNIDLSKYDKSTLQLIRTCMPGVYNFLPRVSTVAQLYLQLYKTLILIRDNYDRPKIDEEFDKVAVLEKIYKRKFDDMLDLLNYFANDIVYHLFIRHAVSLYDKACN